MKFNELYQIVSNLQKENIEIKKINDILYKKIELLEKRIDEIEKVNKKSIESFEKNGKKLQQIKDFNSSIIKTQDNFEFILKILKENIINKNIKFKLLYRASKDGDDVISKF